MKTNLTTLTAAVALAVALPGAVQASSHMDAPLITRDPSANTTDVYAFVTGGDAGTSVSAPGGTPPPSTPKSLVVALAVYPHEEPGVGPNIYNFDDDVLYEIHVATGRDVKAGKATISYQFRFETIFKNQNTILDSYLGVVNDVNDANQNLVQMYTVTKATWHSKTVLGSALLVPPNNQGKATPFYNQGDNGDNAAKNGVPDPGQLDRYTQQSVFDLKKGYKVFAGQRDDGFYGDINSIFDLLSLRSPGKDSQGGFNIHLIALRIPIEELGFAKDQQIVGVYATTSRQKVSVLRDSDRTTKKDDDKNRDNGTWVQVARQGNPLFNEGLVALVDKDRYSRTSPTSDSQLFRKYAETPELAALINAIVFGGNGPAIETGRTDISGIYIPDLIKVDLSTPRARLAGGGPNNPDDPGFSRLGIFGPNGGDVLKSTIQDPFGNGGFIPGGWPNGRRFGDDVVDIAVSALISDLRGPLVIRVADGIDGVSANDIGYNKTFPYEGTPQNGRNHVHP